MILTIEAQFVSLIISIFAGLTGGCLFDLYRTINYYTRPSKAFLYFMDLLFWIVTGIAVFIILLGADFAQLRLYTFAGIGIGIFVYFKLFSEYILKLYRLVIYSAAKFFRVIFILISFPFKVINNLMWAPINHINKTLNKAGKRLKKWAANKLKKLKNKKIKK